MKANHKYLNITILFICLVFGKAQAEKQLPLCFQQETIDNIVQNIISEYAVPMGVVLGPRSFDDPITVAQILKLKDDKTKTLDAEQKRYVNLIDDLIKIKKNLSANQIIDYRQKKLSIDLSSAKNMVSALELLSKVDSNYQLDITNGFSVFYFKSSPLFSYKVNLTCKNVHVKDAYQILADNILKPNKISSVITGDDWPYVDDPDKIISLNIENSDIPTLLSRFAQALGPDVGWHVSTLPAGAYHLQFYKVYPKMPINSIF